MTREEAIKDLLDAKDILRDYRWDSCCFDIAIKSLEAWDSVIDTLTHNYKAAEAQGEFDESVAIIDCIRVIKEKFGELENE